MFYNDAGLHTSRDIAKICCTSEDGYFACAKQLKPSHSACLWSACRGSNFRPTSLRTAVVIIVTNALEYSPCDVRGLNSQVPVDLYHTGPATPRVSFLTMSAPSHRNITGCAGRAAFACKSLAWLESVLWSSLTRNTEVHSSMWRVLQWAIPPDE